MPVHIHHQHVERNVEALEVAYQVAKILVAVAPISAPPVAKGVARRQGNVAGKAGEAFQRLLVVGAVNHEIPVLSALCAWASGHPIPVGVAVEQQAVRVVNQRPSVAGKQSVLNGHGFASVHVAVVAVEGAIGAFQIAFLLHAWFPTDFASAGCLCAGNLQVVFGECSAANLVGKRQLRGGYCEFFARHFSGVLHRSVVALNGNETLVVNKLAVGGVFHSHC